MPVERFRKFNQQKIIKPNLLVGTYKLADYKLAFPQGTPPFPTQGSPYQSYIIIELHDGNLVWGSVYFKPTKAKKWGSARYTGTISRNGQITLNIYSKSIKGGFGQDLATYRLNPIGNNEYEVIFGIVGEGVSFISTAVKSSSDTNFNFPA